MEAHLKCNGLFWNKYDASLYFVCEILVCKVTSNYVCQISVAE